MTMLDTPLRSRLRQNIVVADFDDRGRVYTKINDGVDVRWLDVVIADLEKRRDVMRATSLRRARAL